MLRYPGCACPNTGPPDSTHPQRLPLPSNTPTGVATASSREGSQRRSGHSRLRVGSQFGENRPRVRPLAPGRLPLDEAVCAAQHHKCHADDSTQSARQPPPQPLPHPRPLVVEHRVPRRVAHADARHDRRGAAPWRPCRTGASGSGQSVRARLRPPVGPSGPPPRRRGARGRGTPRPTSGSRASARPPAGGPTWSPPPRPAP